jgi:tRNA pseudouridine55 synthase
LEEIPEEVAEIKEKVLMTNENTLETTDQETSCPEILLADKPKGISSFDVIRVLRRELGIRKMGHAGTLDPLASGLMIIGVGPGTKKLTNLIKLDKTYEAEILIGESRTTGDMEGDILEEKKVAFANLEKDLSEEKIIAELEGMVGTNKLAVPVYSAIKKDGVALYKKARKGIPESDIDIPIKEMEVKGFELTKVEFDLESERLRIYVNFDVGSGTYIRSLAVELGKRLGYPATLANLRRTKVGEFDIKDARKIEWKK